MTATERVKRTQRLLGTAAITQAILWGASTALLIAAAMSLVRFLSHQSEHPAAFEGVAAVIAGVIVAATFLWRSRHFISRNRVALWIEERVPDLQYSLVTAMEHSDSPYAGGMESIIARQNIGGLTSVTLRRRVLPAAGALVLASLLLYVSPSTAFGRSGIFSRLGTGASGPLTPAGSRLESIEAEVTPPAYTNERSTTLDDPSSITALSGSRIVVRGQGGLAGITATAGSTSLRVVGAGDAWSVSLAMPARPAALTLRDRTYDRILVLDPQTDNPPKIVLTSPLRDTTLRVAQLIVHLSATTTDDIGLAGGYFEYLITTGSGEIFSARTVTTPVVHFGGSRTGTLSATLDLASLKLNQGDIVSIRAISQDVNSLSGPGRATSDTRTFRIARADEYDSVAVDPAGPLPVDSSAMSQRMLIMMTEQLVREQKRLTRKELVRRSGEIGDLEDRVRKRVHEILFEIEGGGESEDAAAAPDPTATLEGEESDQIRAVNNPDLLEAYNALWTAVRSLQIAEPEPALPPMRIALKALDRARLANRLYLRGMPPKVIVDIARVRMTGKDKGTANTRTPRTAADSNRVALQARFNSAVELLESKPADAVRALTLMQVEALSVSPQAAASLGEAINAFRKGKDATLPLLRARRSLSGDPESSAGLPAWSGGW